MDRLSVTDSYSGAMHISCRHAQLPMIMRHYRLQVASHCSSVLALAIVVDCRAENVGTQRDNVGDLMLEGVA